MIQSDLGATQKGHQTRAGLATEKLTCKKLPSFHFSHLASGEHFKKKNLGQRFCNGDLDEV